MQLSSTISALPPETDREKALADWILQHCNADSQVLEIGAGRGNLSFPGEISHGVGKLVGIDPDPGISENPFLHEKHQCSLEEYAARCPERFDCTYAYMVMEHLDDPVRFLKTCREVLLPGGHFFAATPNILHYFAMVAWMSGLMGIQDGLLRILVGGEATERYHFRARYRVNRIARITNILQEAGFSQVEFRMLDNPSCFEWYLPKVLGLLPRLYSRSVYWMRKPEFMGTILFHAQP
jgi:2-polyprenyl-3-methyl-5-hydroxy-6-metoxy-1,4-benzoquinol methylase